MAFRYPADTGGGDRGRRDGRRAGPRWSLTLNTEFTWRS